MLISVEVLKKRMWINCGNKKFSEEQLSEAAKILAAGGLVAFPTETVYGLGANALLPEAVAQVYAVKEDLVTTH